MVMRGLHTGDVADTDLALFDENLELASICQFYTVLSFATFCVKLLSDTTSNPDLIKAMRWAGLQGVYGWCLCGIVHSALLFFVAYFGHHDELPTSVVAQARDLVPKVASVASIFSLLATYNMIVICK